MRLSRTLLVLAAALFGLDANVIAQDSPEPPPAPTTPEPKVDQVTTPPLVLNVARQYLKNFLTDETAMAPYKKPDGSYSDLESVFTIGTDNGRYAVFWDPVSCRLLGALDLKAPPKKESVPEPEQEGESEPQSPYPMLAAGAFSFDGTTGAFGDPEYFGFRIVTGKPVFLYTQGSLVVEERLWFEKGGDELKQMFTIREPKNEIKLTIPEAWKSRAEASAGEWSDNVLTIPRDDAAEFVITYRIAGENIEPEKSN